MEALVLRTVRPQRPSFAVCLPPQERRARCLCLLPILRHTRKASGADSCCSGASRGVLRGAGLRDSGIVSTCRACAWIRCMLYRNRNFVTGARAGSRGGVVSRRVA